MKDVSSVQDIKLRASYGIVGSQAISPYATMGLMSATAYNFGTNSNFTGYWANDIATPEPYVGEDQAVRPGSGVLPVRQAAEFQCGLFL